MKGIIWNSNGFRDPKKHCYVSDVTREQNLSFIAILETGRSTFSNHFLKNFYVGKISYGIVKNPKGDQVAYC
jgi:hypothetical protein